MRAASTRRSRSYNAHTRVARTDETIVPVSAPRPIQVQLSAMHLCIVVPVSEREKRERVTHKRPHSLLEIMRSPKQHYGNGMSKREGLGSEGGGKWTHRLLRIWCISSESKGTIVSIGTRKVRPHTYKGRAMSEKSRSKERTDRSTHRNIVGPKYRLSRKINLANDHLDFQT